METNYTESTSNRVFCTECGSPYPPDELVSFGLSKVCINCKPRFLQQLQEGALPVSGVEYGGFWRRVVAILVDGLVISIFTLPISLFFTQQVVVPNIGRTPTFAFGYIGLTYLFSITVNCLYFSYFTSKKGATPGKMLLGMKVVTANGDRLTMGRAVGRFFASMLSWLTFLVGYIMAAFDKQKRTLHDHICSTRVIKT